MHNHEIPARTICKVLRLDQRDSETKVIVALVRVDARPAYYKEPAEHVFATTVSTWPSLVQSCGMIDPAKHKLIPLTGRNKWERDTLAAIERAEKRAVEQTSAMFAIEKSRQRSRDA